jgi:vacuolar-type H+-ATPase subunit E/Vma4
MDKERERVLKLVEEEMAVERSRKMGAADHIYEEKVLEAEHKIATKIVNETKRRLSGVRENPTLYRKVMERLIEEAAEGFDVESSVVYVNPADLELVRKILDKSNRRFRVEGRKEVDFGIIIEDPGRGYRVYNTFEFRLGKAKTYLLEKMEEIVEGKG